MLQSEPTVYTVSADEMKIVIEEHTKGDTTQNHSKRTKVRISKRYWYATEKIHSKAK